jgi:phage terminase small subunit
MGEMTVPRVVKILRNENPACPLGDLTMYAEGWLVLREAAANIAKNGAIVAHPRTNAPIENPYFRIMAAQMKSLQGLKRVRKTDQLWLSDPTLRAEKLKGRIGGSV